MLSVPLHGPRWPIPLSPGHCDSQPGYPRSESCHGAGGELGGAEHYCVGPAVLGLRLPALGGLTQVLLGLTTCVTTAMSLAGPGAVRMGVWEGLGCLPVCELGQGRPGKPWAGLDISWSESVLGTVLEWSDWDCVSGDWAGFQRGRLLPVTLAGPQLHLLMNLTYKFRCHQFSPCHHELCRIFWKDCLLPAG